MKNEKSSKYFDDEVTTTTIIGWNIISDSNKYTDKVWRNQLLIFGTVKMIIWDKIFAPTVHFWRWTVQLMDGFGRQIMVIRYQNVDGGGRIDQSSSAEAWSGI